MRKTNLQIRVSEEIGSQIEDFAPRSKSEFVRQAIEEKLQRERFRRLEEKWIEALQKNPEETKEADAWLKEEAWERR